MSSVTRPGPSYSSSSRQQQAPYPQPGTAKPAQPRGATGGAGYRGPSERTIARAKWARITDGAPFLEPGPSNRLVLSIRSTVPAEVSFGLERLVQISSLDPDLLRLSEFPGLLDGLVGLVREYVDRRRADRAKGALSLAQAVLGEEPREAVRTRAAAAALVLRNVAPLKGSLEVILGSKRLRKLICEVLDEGAGDGPQAEETTELRLYLLDVLESIADKVPLALPGHAITPDTLDNDDEDDSRPPPQPEPLDSPAVRLFPLLVALTRSNDRALVLAAFRCLTVLSTNNKSDPVFALLSYDSVQPLPKPHPHPIQTAIELLPLADAELTTAVLDFIYQHTTLASNVVLFSTRPELLGILRLLCSKFHVKARLEDVSIDLRVARTDGTQWHDSLPKRHQRAAQAQAVTDADSPLSPEELASILRMPEPARCIAWMRLAYEPDPTGDVTQVAFWKSYETLFQRNIGAGIPAMLVASEVIKHASDGHPSATPVVLDGPDRKFVIKGIRLRKRPDLASLYRCRWTGCTSTAILNTPLACYHHVRDAHLVESSAPSCAWQGCSYTPSQPDSSLRLAELSLHVRAHLPSLLSSSTTPAAAAATDLADLPAILPHERHHAERDASTKDLTAAGASLLSVLIVRNLARTAKLALDAKLTSSSSAQNGAAGAGGAPSVASANAAIGRLAGDEQSIFEAFAAAAEGLAKKDGVLSRLEKVDYTAALPAVEALLSVEEGLVQMVMSDVALGKVLGEVVGLVEYCRRRVKGMEKEKEGGAAEAEAMQS
ncbi:hypothetical protein JCM6882_002729 [Rhodosporidiobolus microsporus]